MLKYKIPQIVTLTPFVREKGKDTKGMGIKKGVPLYSNLC
jgi:hypothetical protein